MEPSSKKNSAHQKEQSRFTKLFSFFLNFFGKKTKTTFFSVISHLLEDYEKEGLINSEEKKMFKNIAFFGDKKAASIMTPRADLIAIKHNSSLEEIKKVIVSDGHTRIPVYKEDFDEIIGFIHSKDLAKFLCKEDPNFSLEKVMRKILFVPGSMKLLELMRRMRVSRVHVAIVLDEFGGVDGLVTIENLMEQIVGDIEDEHDLPSDNSSFRVKKINNKTYHFGGRVEIEKLEEIFQIKIRRGSEDFYTVNGLLSSLFKRVPDAGEEVSKYGLSFKIIDADGRLVKLVEVSSS